MTVQELIEKLESLEDKAKDIAVVGEWRGQLTTFEITDIIKGEDFEYKEELDTDDYLILA